MGHKWIEQVTGSLQEKKRYRRYQARTRALPANYRMATEALERYLMYAGAISQGDVMVSMLEDLLELFEVSAEDGTSIHGIVGDDPVEFAETFLQNYSQGRWVNKERRRLADAIARATDQQGGAEKPR